MSRREIFAGNWKMYKTSGEAAELVKGILNGLGNIGDREVVVFPPSVYLKEIVNICKNTSIDAGIQNIHFEKEGAFTGEISPLMAADTGARYALIGHSERRHIFHETDDDVNRKIKATFAYGLEPVVCVGELLEERESGSSEAVVKKQVEHAFAGTDSKLMSRVIIAYEPVWAIGTGKVATPEIADSMHKYIRNIIKNLFNDKISDDLPILYGGSVKPDNITELFAMKNIDGVLVGGASLKINSFLDIIHVKNNK
jgi:triosephosphate isomerase (TIM)